MKLKLLFISFSAFISAVMALQLTTQYHESQVRRNLYAYKQKTILKCGPNWEAILPLLEEADIPPIPGAGKYQWKISTTNDSAQFYFNQGINMYYGFHIIEAMASFKKAEKFDPNCAMLYWAKALAFGPNINDLGYAASPDALVAIQKAIELSSKISPVEKALIQAQASRYSADTTKTRVNLNQIYVDQMMAIYQSFPTNADVAALYADALMLQHPWDLWFTNGQPKEWTPTIQSVLEKLLKQTPLHPGANHYYIHVMEPSPFAALAIPSADRLGSLTPGLSHMVHMPSHIYLRTGNYTKGVQVNEQAVISYQQSIPLFGAVTGSDFLYIIHNLHMQTNHAILAGNMKTAIQSATATANSISNDYLQIEGAMGNYIQYVYQTKVFVDIRFGQWDALIQATKPDTKQVYANIIYHFGKGMALAGTHQINAAKKELTAIKTLMSDPVLSLPFTPFSPAIDGADIAANLLAGTIAVKEKDFPNGIEFFSKAVSKEEQMVYNEPRDWILNPKHYLGNALLLNQQWKEAAIVFNQDLKNNENNIWALNGLYIAQSKLHQVKEAGITQQKIKQVSKQADLPIKTAIF